ncbi:deleted in malignant brain tumors 1 protein [Strongylocentrotus purpuratus]|uniref:SRCR domain-containing protein n=1 Tax=Strongylocentrotus purpuratus TaxID=7668 RepID=A0A7M7NNW8_STRPU|nr:deleted in malignant brain tumors 1 protein [Strongylocentrotus purpuratus]
MGYFTIRRVDSFWGGNFSDQTIEKFLMRQLKTSRDMTRGRGITDTFLANSNNKMRLIQTLRDKIRTGIEQTETDATNLIVSAAQAVAESEQVPVVVVEPLRTRLVGGISGSFEGRVEVYYQGAWGTVCDDGWDLDDAHVVCHTLGYPRASAYYHGANFGEGTGEIILDDVNCEGSESNIAFCHHRGYLTHNCGHAADAGVTCVGTVPVRLVDGASANEGRVEVNYQGSWGTICNDSWDINDATVVCRMLGYPGVSSALVSFGEATGDIILDNVGCDGSETHIAHCTHDGYEIHNCGHSEDVGVVRLVGGRSDKEGRVEILYLGTWGTVCDDNWDLNDANVVCRMLGYERAENFSCCAAFGLGPGPIVLDEVECEDDLQVRLVGGRSDKEGRVEILYLGTWGTVCDDNWDLNDANVVCRMLGYERAENFSCCAAFGLGQGPIVLDEVKCEGTEPNIVHCRRSGYENHDCDHLQDVGVSCIEYEVDQESSTKLTTDGSKMGQSRPARHDIDRLCLYEEN